MITSVNSDAQTKDWWQDMANPKAWDAANVLPSAENIVLFASNNPDRSSAKPLDDSTVTGPVYIFSGPDEGVARVQFWLDASITSPATKTENIGPFDFSGTGPGGIALASDSNTLSTGVTHTIIAQATMVDGSVKPAVTATFRRY
jgi:hypothetical protein